MILLNRMISFLGLEVASIKRRCFHSIYLQKLYFTTLTLDNIALAMILGCLPLLIQHSLFSQTIYYIIILVALFLLLVPFALFRFLAIFLFFWVYSNMAASSLMTRTEQFADNVATIETKVIEYRQLTDGNIVIKIPMTKKTLFSSSIYANVYWRNPPKNIAVGQHWKFKIQFRAVHSYLNEGGFDNQKYAVSMKETLTGKVMSAKFIRDDISLRTQFIETISAYWQTTKNKGEIIALVLGDKRYIEPEKKDLYMKTGVAHLIVISGLHIGLAAFAGWGIARGIQFLFPIRWINPQFPLVMAWLCGVFYAALSGWGIPATRAVIGLTVWVMLHWGSRLFLPWQWALWSAALILIVEPLSILSASFWLSFSAVFAIIFWYWMSPLKAKYNHQKRWFILRLIHLQFGLLIILLPFQFYLFGGANFFSFIVNLWAVPIISFITVPLIMFGLLTSFSSFLQPIIWHWVDLSINFAFWCAPLFLPYWQYSGTVPFLLGFSGVGIIVMIKMSWWRHHFILLIAVGILLYCEFTTFSRYQWRMSMLDVGHGLAIILEKDREAIIYDTGIRWKSGGSIAKSVIIPYLKYHRLNPVALIISHDHLDHTGGIKDLIKAYPHLSIRSSFDDPSHLACLSNESWQWKGLQFDALWPPNKVLSPKNNQSCVINVSDGKHTILLTGDIEKEAEAQLVRVKKDQLKADVLQVPHHGSQTSSTLAFIQTVSPKFALVSAARYSLWRLPSDKVHLRYKKEAINWLTTSISGQISIEFNQDNIDVFTYRRDILPRWYHQWFGVLTFPE
ncbi:DNA internalization-related competence protein ComEC/Rec2 [Proteus penneri]|uniref:DNA internalization-related competence protein ComEC/Rec2 n=1 Tax=Proteus penneri TaxID=102862 RepID=A0ABS0W3V3_9GAMM|nr:MULTISPECIES: DNA internalization-related competence protein ComEC/Rec2 [Proteus]MBJ2117970.1 DNA internalization-related competence protein ComEC/Rec2 [Proteus penneri]NBM12254.1 DNA internalization-related competence protein ComEC/Rec2 [Proteus sp. G2670]NBM31147.1 DNA internalization-related competence protein ComEC/Rec2 [Proteus sp. G2664]NBM50297.1 DNA internalization-related competence protein ComEC/Rec2 [Proteus sp. G2666]NBM70035.1 DNA internalization-related competence protein ComE